MGCKKIYLSNRTIEKAENIKKKFTVEIEEVEIVKEDVTFKIPGKLN